MIDIRGRELETFELAKKPSGVQIKVDDKPDGRSNDVPPETKTVPDEKLHDGPDDDTHREKVEPKPGEKTTPQKHHAGASVSSAPTGSEGARAWACCDDDPSCERSTRTAGPVRCARDRACVCVGRSRRQPCSCDRPDAERERGRRRTARPLVGDFAAPLVGDFAAPLVGDFAAPLVDDFAAPLVFE